MKIGALVPARISSKRIPKKNILPLGGKPLIYWTLDALLEAEAFDDITVSTESGEIAEVVRQRYSKQEVQILNRPESLAGCNSPLRDVARHYLENRPGLDFMGFFLPTYPFRKSNKIREAFREVLSGHALRVESVSEDEVCSHDYYYPCEGGASRFLKGPPSYFRYNSSCYLFFHRDFPEQAYMGHGFNINEMAYRLTVDWREGIDIDTEKDLELASKAVEAPERRLKPIIGSERDGWTLIGPKGLDADALFDHVGKKRLSNRSLPLLILDTATPPFFMNRLGNSVSRIQFTTYRAHTYLFSNKEIHKTQNGQLIPSHFTQSRAVRFIPSPLPGEPFVEKFDAETLTDYDPFEDHFIPQDRIFLLDDLKRLGLQVDAYEYFPTEINGPGLEGDR